MTSPRERIVQQHANLLIVDHTQIDEGLQLTHGLPGEACLRGQHREEGFAQVALTLDLEAQPGKPVSKWSPHERLGEPSCTASLRAHHNQEFDEIGIPERLPNLCNHTAPNEKGLLLPEPLVRRVESGSSVSTVVRFPSRI